MYTLVTDCPNNGLCCFDGCADTCVDGPKPPPQTTTPYSAPPPPPPAIEPVEAESESQPEEVGCLYMCPLYHSNIRVSQVGYSYPAPEVPLEFPAPKPPPPDLPTLYGAPPI